MNNRKTILVSAYTIDPFKGSEAGMGWQFVNQIADNFKVIAFTRENNRSAIERYLNEHPESHHRHMQFMYFDLPYWMRFWKKGGRGALLYFYMWQFFLPKFINKHELKYDLVHNLNFHNDWTPTFLWKLKKPLVWGPIGHHPKIPSRYIKIRKERWLANLKWVTKSFFWYFDPFLDLSHRKAKKILYMHTGVLANSNMREKYVKMPSVASEFRPFVEKEITAGLRVISVGRFESLKAFDLTLDAFNALLQRISLAERALCKLTLVGKGSQKEFLLQKIDQYNLHDKVEIISWLPRDLLLDLYKEADVFFFPSHEGAGMVVAEAMSFGLPVVCFDNHGPGEFQSDPQLKVPYSDYNNSVNQFAEILKQLLEDPATRIEKSTQSYLQYIEKFEWSNRSIELKHVYEEVFEK